MSTELEEHQLKRQQAEEDLNRAYRIVFVTEKPSQAAFKAARKRVRQDLDDIIYERCWRISKNGTHCPYRSVFEDGFRFLAKELQKRISSKPDSGMEKKKIKVTK